MALLDGSDFSNGFPFSASRLSDALHGASGRPSGIQVTAPQIPEVGRALTRTTAADPVTQRTLAAASGSETTQEDGPTPLALQIGTTPTLRRFLPLRSGLRLMPLGAFLWGGDCTSARPRTRPEHAMVWVTGGSHRLGFPCAHAKMAAGELRYIPAGTAFTSHPQPETEGHVLLISPDLAQGLQPALPLTVVSGGVADQAEGLMVTLRELVKEAAKSSDSAVLRCHLALLAARLLRLEPAPAHQPSPPDAGVDHPLVARFLDAAGCNLSASRTLAEQAEELGTTLTALDRACLTAHGRRAVDLLNSLRIERAARMLRATVLSGTQIAQATGYGSQAHFTRAFVAATGRTPEVFRSQIRAGRGSD